MIRETFLLFKLRFDGSSLSFYCDLNLFHSDCSKLITVGQCYGSGSSQTVSTLTRTENSSLSWIRYYPFLSKSWIITFSPQINITKSSFAMLPNMKMGLRISRRESGTFLSRYSIWSYFYALSSGVTERFQKISLEIIEIKKGLREQEPPQTQAALMIEKVQVAYIYQFGRPATPKPSI